MARFLPPDGANGRHGVPVAREMPGRQDDPPRPGPRRSTVEPLTRATANLTPSPPLPGVVERTVAFRTPWFDVVRKTLAGAPDDEGYYAVRPGNYVAVLGLTVDGDVMLVRQYRPVVEAFTVELPSGHVDAGETPEESARREFREETGYAVGRLELLGVLRTDCGRLDNTMWCYLGTDCAPTGEPAEDGVEPLRRSPADLLADVRGGAFDCALHLAVLSLAITSGRLAAC